MTHATLQLVFLALLVGALCAAVWMLVQWNKELKKDEDEQRSRRRPWTHL